jgi:hypothetical protein
MVDKVKRQLSRLAIWNKHVKDSAGDVEAYASALGNAPQPEWYAGAVQKSEENKHKK